MNPLEITTETQQTLRSRLLDGMSQMEIELEAQQVKLLVDFLVLMAKWNQVYNLTSVRDPLQMVSRHVLDSLSALPYLHGKTLLDVGTGGGVPGIPLAIARPDIHCTLLDSNGKKTRFVQQVVTELALKNVTVLKSRVQDVELEPVDTLISRAFSTPLDIMDKCGHLFAKSGIMLFMMAHLEGKLANLPENYTITELAPVGVPFEEGLRHIVAVGRVSAGSESG